MKYDNMSMAHRRTKSLIKKGDSRPYQTILSVALKAVNMMYRECTIDDVNYLKSMHLNGLVDLSLLESLHKNNTYNLNFSDTGKIKIVHKNPYYVHGKKYVRSQFN